MINLERKETEAKTKIQALPFFLTTIHLAVGLLCLAGMTIQVAYPSALAIPPITWNGIDLDNSHLHVEPSTFAIGAQELSTRAIPSIGMATFNWNDALDTYPGNTGSNLCRKTLDVLTLLLAARDSPGTCQEACFSGCVTTAARSSSHPFQGVLY